MASPISIATVWSGCLGFNCTVTFLYNWQTLVTGGLAGVLAYLAVSAARKQLKAAEDQLAADMRSRERDRLGRLRAARLSLPPTLSALCDFAEDNFNVLKDAWPAVARLYPQEIRPHQALQIKAEMRPFPDAIIPVLERVVEHTDDQHVIDRIAGILREYQVLAARTRGISNGIEMTQLRLADAALQCVSLYVRVESLFDFARSRSETVSAEDLWTRALSFLEFRLMDPAHMIAAEALQQRDAGRPLGEAETTSI